MPEKTTEKTTRTASSRDEKIAEILAILGDVFHRVGYQQTVPSAMGGIAPDAFARFPYAQGEYVPPAGYAAMVMPGEFAWTGPMRVY